MRRPEKLFKHVVLWKLKENAEGKTKAENADWLKKHLEDLVGVIPQLVDAKVGININTSNDAYDAVLISTFMNEEDCAAYKAHSAHIIISNYCKKVRKSRVVCDYWDD